MRTPSGAKNRGGGADDNSSPNQKVREQAPIYESPEQAEAWWRKTGKDTYAAAIIGNKNVSAKAKSVFLLDRLVSTGVLDHNRFRVPESVVIAPSSVSRAPSKLDHPDDVAAIVARFRRSQVFESSYFQIMKMTKWNPSGKIMVRSAGMAEGGPGQSAAGVFLSEESRLAPDYFFAAATNVVKSAFSPAALFLTKEYGLRPSFPGLIVQPKIEGITCMFDTSVPGMVRYSHYPKIRPYCEKLGVISDREDRSYDWNTRLLRERIHEAASILSCNGRIPIEVELVLPRESKVAYLVQHRFVTGLLPQDFPEFSPAIVETDNVIGSNSVAESWIVDVKYANHGGLAAMWLAQKELKARGITSFAVIATPWALSSLHGKGAEAIPFIHRAQALVETGRGGVHESSPDSHTVRLAYDRGAISLFADFDYRAVRDHAQEYIKIDHTRMWSEEDRLYLHPAVAAEAASPSYEPEITVFRLASPLMVVADEFKERGALYLT